MPSMRRTFAGVAFLAVALVVPAAQAQNDKKKDDKKKTSSTLDGAKSLSPGTYSGKLTSVAGTSITLQMEFERLEMKSGNTKAANRELLRAQQDLSRAQLRMTTARTLQQRLSAQRSYQNVVNRLLNVGSDGKPGTSPYKLITDTKDYDI